jgi:hypothetical protein
MRCAPGAEVAWRPDDKTLVVAGLDYRDRDYDAPFMRALIASPRADERFTAELRVEREVSERLTAFAAAGHLDNELQCRAARLWRRDLQGRLPAQLLDPSLDPPHFGHTPIIGWPYCRRQLAR